MSSELVKNYFSLLESAISAGNYMNAEEYCDKIINLEPNNWLAWSYKGRALSFRSSFGNLRIAEAITCWATSIKYSGNEKAKAIKMADEHMEAITVSMLGLAASLIEDGINKVSTSNYMDYCKMILDCQATYITSVNGKYEFEPVVDRGIALLPDSLYKAINTLISDYNKLVPNRSQSLYKSYLDDLQKCIDLCNDIMRIYPNKYQLCINLLKVEKRAYKVSGDLEWVDYNMSTNKYIPYSIPKVTIDNYIKDVDSRLKVAEDNLYWQTHPEAYKEKLLAEKEDKAFQKKFWEEHAEDKEKIRSNISDLCIRQKAIKNKRSKEYKVITEKIKDGNEIFNVHRSSMEFTGFEKTYIDGTCFDDVNKAAELDKKKTKNLITALVAVVVAFVVGVIGSFIIKAVGSGSEYKKLKEAISDNQISAEELKEKFPKKNNFEIALMLVDNNNAEKAFNEKLKSYFEDESIEYPGDYCAELVIQISDTGKNLLKKRFEYGFSFYSVNQIDSYVYQKLLSEDVYSEEFKNTHAIHYGVNNESITYSSYDRSVSISSNAFTRNYDIEHYGQFNRNKYVEIKK